MGALVVQHGQADLLEAADALCTPRGLARRLDGGEEQGDQDSDDRDHDQELDQGETVLLSTIHGTSNKRSIREGGVKPG